MNKQNRKPYFPIIIVFIILNGLILSLRTFLENRGFDQEFLIWANIFLFVLSMGGFLLQRRGLRAPNPQVFVRGVYASMIFKLFLVMIVVLVYVFLSRQNINKPGLFTAMGLYIVYTAVEVSALKKVVKQKKDG
jgi:hypothetical protein